SDLVGMVQNYAETSKDSYERLEDVLETCQSSLDDDLTEGQDFASEIDSVVEMHDERSKVTEAFSNYFDQFSQQLGSQEVSGLLASLERHNNAVYERFQHYEDENQSIVDVSANLQSQFSSLNETMTEYKGKLENKLDVRLEEVIKEIFEEKSNDTDYKSYTNTMRMLFNNLDANV